MNSYDQTLDYLFTQLPMFQREGKSAYKANLNNTRALETYFETPHKNYKIIHVGGTNGKGSVSHTLAAILQAAGYKTGLFTSPHLKDFRERIRINGQKIDCAYVVEFVSANRHFFTELKPSFFEITAIMAMKYFADQQVDIAVLEVGMGGRLDSTNIVSPMLSVITNISFDHTMFLGDTLAKIAYEKAGIIKPETPVVIGETQPEIAHVFTEKANSLNAPISFADQIFGSNRI